MTATDADRTAGQFRALATLGHLLQRQAPEKLPPIDWTITTTGTLHGHCADRGTFFAWQRALGDPDHEHGLSDGTRLTSTWEAKDGVQVVLTVTIRDDEPAGEPGQ